MMTLPLKARAMAAAFIVLLLGSMSRPVSAQSTTSYPVEPVRGVFYSRENISEARSLLQREPWRQKMADQITSGANVWVNRSSEWLRRIIPVKGSVFAYGVSGCPACGARWKNFGVDTCSFDSPGKVKCTDCRRTFPDPDPKSVYHDPGSGVTINGKKYYLRGVWNSFVVQSLWSVPNDDSTALSLLSHAYALTGRSDYARKALEIMDALATLSPTTKGPRDFDLSKSGASDQGRLHFLTSQYHRAIVPLARNFDVVGKHASSGDPSPTGSRISIWNNIRENLFDEYLFKHFDVREGRMSTMHNHEADTVRAMIAVGVLFDDVREYRRWGASCLDSLLMNTLDRDGMYYETSTNYAMFTRGVFMDMAEMLENNFQSWRGRGFGLRSNFFDSRKLPSLMINNYDLSVAGHQMNFGNAHPDRAVVTEPGTHFGPIQWTLLAKFLHYLPEGELRARVLGMLSSQLAGRERTNFGSRWWLMKMEDTLPLPAAAQEELSPVGSGKFFSTKGMAAFQAGDYPNRRGFVVRGGPNLPHAQDDLLGLNLYDVGRELSAEIGYGIFDSHVHKGWGTRAIAHNLVVVDEDAALQGDEYFKKSPGASWRSFYDSPQVKFIDADATAQFAGKSAVTQYRRRIAMIDVNTSASYYVDVFDVTGGSTRDYSLHGPYNDALLTNALTIKGTAMQPQPNVWTLAALNPKWQAATWNAPGKSWGERVTTGEYLKKLAPDDEVGAYGWAAPGRGYGFLYNVQSAQATSPWSATWKLQGKDNAHYRAHVLPTKPMLAIRANAPDLTGEHLHNFIVARDEKTTGSRFVVIHEPFRGAPVIRDARLLPTPVKGALVVRVALQDGRTDYITMANDSIGFVGYETTTSVSALAWAEFSFLRVDESGEQPVTAHLFRGERIELGDNTLVESLPSFQGVVRSTDESDGSIVVEVSGNESTPTLESARFVTINSKSYTHNTGIQLYPKDIMLGPNNLVRLKTGSAILQKFATDSQKGTVATSSIPLPLTFVHERPTRFLDGKTLVSTDERMVARIVKLHDMKTIEMDKDVALQPGQQMFVYDFVPGDQVELPLSASWHRHESED